MTDFGFKKTDLVDEKRQHAVHGEIPADAGIAGDQERELDLGAKENPDATPGSPAVQGGGLTSEIGHTPPGTDPDR
jgi:hypothetical protein